MFFVGWMTGKAFTGRSLNLQDLHVEAPRQSCTSGSEQILGGLTPMRITARRIPKHACGSPFRRKAQNNRV